MSEAKGRAFLLKTADGVQADGTTRYATKAGLRVTAETIAGKLFSIAGMGVFTGNAAEHHIRTLALSGSVDDYELSFESGERVRGKFLITKLDYAGDMNGERSYLISLESSGDVVTL